jgi:hypothetical protein
MIVYFLETFYKNSLSLQQHKTSKLVFFLHVHPKLDWIIL